MENFLAIDVETTGLSPTADRVIEVAVVQFVQGREVQAWTRLVQPGIPLPEGTLRLSGITTEMLAGQPTFPQLAPDLARMLEGATVVAHNAEFDWGFIAQEFRRAALAVPTVRLVDTLPECRRLWPGGKNDLGSVCTRLGIDPGTAHRAEDDARATGLVCLGIVGLVPAGRDTTLALTRTAEDSPLVANAKLLIIPVLERLGTAREVVAAYGCASDADVDRGTKMLARLKEIQKGADADRIGLVESLKKETAQIDAHFRELVRKPIDALTAEIQRRMEPYQTAKAHALEEQRREEARKAREAQEALERQAAEERRAHEAAAAKAAAEAAAAAAAAASAAAADRARLEAEAAAAAAAAQTAIAAHEEAVSQIDAGLEQSAQAGAALAAMPLGAAMTTRTGNATAAGEWAYTVRVVDPARVPAEFWVIDEKRLQAAAEAGVEKIPGVEISKTWKTRVIGRRGK